LKQEQALFAGGDMDSRELHGKWEQFRGIVQEFWGELTGSDLDYIAGERHRLVGKLEEKYGMSREEAERKVDEIADRL
jgi:uncharacterized protein YjbJ (UPF0337 family)